MPKPWAARRCLALVILGVFAAVVLAIIVRGAGPVSATVHFVEIRTNSLALYERYLVFRVQNNSAFPVRREGCLINGEYFQIDPQILKPGESEEVKALLPRTLQPPMAVTFNFTRPESLAEGVFERISAILKTSQRRRGTPPSHQVSVHVSSE